MIYEIIHVSIGNIAGWGAGWQVDEYFYGWTVKTSIFILLSKYMNRQQPNNISKTIQDFNRQCAEEKTKRLSYLNSKYEKRIQNYSIDLASKLGEGTFSKVY